MQPVTTSDPHRVIPSASHRVIPSASHRVIPSASHRVIPSAARDLYLVAAVLFVLAPFAAPLCQTRDTTKLEAVVVTATRNPLSIGDIPASVTVLSGADLRARGVVSVTDALREVPGGAIAQTGSFGGQTSVFVRGGQSNYTKVLIDGVPMNQSGGAFDFSTLTTDNVER